MSGDSSAATLNVPAPRLNALQQAWRIVLLLVGILIVVQALIVVRARPQDLITGINGMADILRRATPPISANCRPSCGRRWRRSTSRCSARSSA